MSGPDTTVDLSAGLQDVVEEEENGRQSVRDQEDIPEHMTESHRPEPSSPSGSVEEAPRWGMLESEEGLESPGSGGSSPQVKKEEPAQPLSEEEILKIEAAKWIQRTVRGHQTRRAAQYTMIWALYPSPVGQNVWGYQGFWHIKSVHALQLEFDFKERLDLLNAVLAEGLSRLPHLFSKDIGRPMAKRKTRAQFLQELIGFCMMLAAAYWNEGLSAPATFLWSSVVALCALPPIPDELSVSRQPDRCHFRGKTATHICALDNLALVCYRQHDFEAALEHMEKALELCLTPTAGRLPFCILSAHKAVILAGLSQNERALLQVEDVIPILSTVAENPMGELELLEARKVIAHVLLTSCHNFSVQLRVLGKLVEAKEAAESSFGLTARSCHSAQPVSRIILHSYTASIRQDPSHPLSRQRGYAAPSDEGFSRTSSAGTRMLAATQLLGGTEAGAQVERAPSAGTDKSWRKWLSITVKESPYIAPLWIDGAAPSLELNEAAQELFEGTFINLKTAARVMEAVNKATRRDGTPSHDLIGAVSKCVLKLCAESRLLVERDDLAAAKARVNEVQALMARSEFPMVDLLPWWLQAHAVLCTASFLYQHDQDYAAAMVETERAVAICDASGGGGYLGAVAKVAAAAVMIREGQHDQAFHLAQRALAFCQRSTAPDSVHDPVAQREKTDILVAASHAMALTHLFMGHSKIALRLSRTASEHVQHASYGDSSGLHYLQVTRVYELALSMSEMAETHTLPFIPSSKLRYKAAAPSATHPSAFVPCAILRNLPEGYMEYMEPLGGRKSSLDLARIGERIVQQQLQAPSDDGGGDATQESGGEADREGRKEGLPAVRGKRYKWSGQYVAAHGDGGAADHAQPLAHVASRTSSARTAEMRMGAPQSRAVTPYGSIALTSAQVASMGAHEPQLQSGTGSEWVDELLLGKDKGEFQKQREDDRSKLYFAQVFRTVRDSTSQLADPLDVVSRRRYRVGDHCRPRRLGGSGQPSRRNARPASRGTRQVGEPVHSAEADAVLRRSWAPDQTHELLRASRQRAADEIHKIRGGARSTTPSMRSSSSASAGAEGGERMRGKADGIDWVNLRIEKHEPFDAAIRRSTLGLFISARDRQDLLSAVEEHNQRPLSSVSWSPTRQPSDPRPDPAARRTESHHRPFYWSHKPDPSHYLHSLKGGSLTAKANASYRALPYGPRLSPAAKQAYGTTTAPVLGPRSLQSMNVDPTVISHSAELGEPPVVATPAARCLTSFY